MLKNSLQEKTREALKSGDSLRVSTLRLLYSALHNEQINKQRELAPEEEIVVVKRQVKQREEAIEAYDKAGRSESAEKERQELRILKEFMPEEISEEELGKMVDQSVEEMGASQQDFGKVMQVVVKKVAGRADGKTIVRLVRSRLGMV